MRVQSRSLTVFLVIPWLLVPPAGSQATRRPVEIQARGATAAVGQDADDPAVWVHPQDPSRSLIPGTDKAAAPRGALYVFDLEGRVVQILADLDRPKTWMWNMVCLLEVSGPTSPSSRSDINDGSESSGSPPEGAA